MIQQVEVRTFFEAETNTLTHVVYDPATRDAVVIDPVLDFDPLQFQTATKSVEEVAQFLTDEGLKLHFVLETHAHADHLSASQWLKRRFSVGVVIGANISEVQKTFRDIFDMPESFPVDGSQFDWLVHHGETFVAGSLQIGVIGTPGHTPACVTYRIGDAIFVGDAVFIEDYGTGRCDFPGGSAERLYDSVHGRLYALPEETRVFVGHDYPPDGRAVRVSTTVGALRERNVQLKHSTTKEEFVAFRSKRDATLAQPRLLFPSVQINIDAGTLPTRSGNGNRYLRFPINLKTDTDDAGRPIKK